MGAPCHDMICMPAEAPIGHAVCRSQPGVWLAGDYRANNMPRLKRLHKANALCPAIAKPSNTPGIFQQASENRQAIGPIGLAVELCH